MIKSYELLCLWRENRLGRSSDKAYFFGKLSFRSGTTYEISSSIPTQAKSKVARIGSGAEVSSN
jgi:hypothetical protein